MITFWLLLSLTNPMFPGNWKVVGDPVVLPPDLGVSESGRCRVDVTGKFFYTTASHWQIDLKSGVARFYGVFRFHHPPQKDLFRLSYEHLENDGWEITQFHPIYYASGESLGGYISMTTQGGARPDGCLLSVIGAPKQPYDRGFDPLLHVGLDWLLSPGYGNGAPVIIHGSDGKEVPLPREFWNPYRAAAAIDNGVVWDKKRAYIIWDERKGSGTRLYDVEFGGKPVVWRPVPLTPHLTEYGWPRDFATEFEENVLADASIVKSVANLQEKGQSEAGDANKHIYGTRVFDPLTKKWGFFEGLFIWGSSQDGRYIAFSLPPWKTLTVARVFE